MKQNLINGQIKGDFGVWVGEKELKEPLLNRLFRKFTGKPRVITEIMAEPGSDLVIKGRPGGVKITG